MLVVDHGGAIRNRAVKKFWQPPTDLFEDERFFIVRSELAGVHSGDIQIVYLPDRHSLLIRGVRQEEDLPGAEKRGCHQLEIYFGEFEREIELPKVPVEPLEIKAQFRSGFLYVLAPKATQRMRHVHMTITRA